MTPAQARGLLADARGNERALRNLLDVSTLQSARRAEILRASRKASVSELERLAGSVLAVMVTRASLDNAIAAIGIAWRRREMADIVATAPSRRRR